MSLRRLAVLLGVAASLSLPPTASSAHAAAGDDAHAVAVSIPAIASGVYKQQAVHCAAGERATGGGIGFVSSAGVGAAIIRESWPFISAGGVPTGWVSAIWNQSGAPQSFTAYAICSASADAVYQGTQFTTKFDGSSLAPCQAGEQAIGGGVGAPDGPTVAAVQVSGPVDDTGQAVSTDDGDVPSSWYVSVRHLANTGLTFTAYAVCSPTTPPTPPAAPEAPSAGAAPAADTAAEADAIGAVATRSRIGKRVVRVELEVEERLSARLVLVRKGATLATKRFAAVRPGSRVLTVVVPRRVKKGRTALRVELADAGGNTRALKLRVTIPVAGRVT